MLMISVDEVMDILEEYAVCTPDEEKSLIQRINQASMFIDNIGTVSKWISVKDRLPEIGKSVLIYYPKWDGDEIQVAKLEDDGMMFDICGEFNIGTGVVTHWMPLPQPPKESGVEWVDNKCSVCGKGIENLIESREWYENEKPNYCPFCGTMFIMKGSDAE